MPMSGGQLDTLLLRDYVDRYRAGDAGAADQLFRAVGARLECLAHRMVRGFPKVRALTETADVLQSSLLRLLNTLRELQPTSTRHFFNLVAASTCAGNCSTWPAPARRTEKSRWPPLGMPRTAGVQGWTRWPIRRAIPWRSWNCGAASTKKWSNCPWKSARSSACISTTVGPSCKLPTCYNSASARCGNAGNRPVNNSTV